MNTDYLVEVLLLMLTAVLVENYIFSKFLGICPFLGVSDKPDTALGMGFAVMFVMTISSAATWAVYNLILVPFHLEYLHLASQEFHSEADTHRLLHSHHLGLCHGGSAFDTGISARP